MLALPSTQLQVALDHKIRLGQNARVVHSICLLLGWRAHCFRVTIGLACLLDEVVEDVGDERLYIVSVRLACVLDRRDVLAQLWGLVYLCLIHRGYLRPSRAFAQVLCRLQVGSRQGHALVHRVFQRALSLQKWIETWLCNHGHSLVSIGSCRSFFIFRLLIL